MFQWKLFWKCGSLGYCGREHTQMRTVGRKNCNVRIITLSNLSGHTKAYTCTHTIISQHTPCACQPIWLGDNKMNSQQHFFFLFFFFCTPEPDSQRNAHPCSSLPLFICLFYYTPSPPTNTHTHTHTLTVTLLSFLRNFEEVERRSLVF